MTDKTDVMRGEFEAWAVSYELQKDSIAKFAWQAALQSPAVRELVEAAEFMLAPAYYGPDQDDLRKALANFASIKGDKA